MDGVEWYGGNGYLAAREAVTYTPPALTPLTEEQEWEIKRDYLYFYYDPILDIDQVAITQYLGTYGNLDVLFMDTVAANYEKEYRQEIYDGYTFSFSDSQNMLVHRYDGFYTIKEAVKNGWLTTENIRDIRWYYYNTERLPRPEGEYTPFTPMTFEPLTAEQEQQLKEQYWNECIAKGRISETELEFYKMEYITIDEYLGTYQGCPVVRLNGIFGYHCAEDPVMVAGYLLVFGDGNHHQICKDGEFIEISEAYERGWITKEDVCQIKWQMLNS